MIQKLRLKKQEERRLQTGHLWIFSNEIDVAATPLNNFTSGQLVKIESHSGKELGVGYINPNSLLCTRLLTSNPRQEINLAFFVERIALAEKLRASLYEKPYYRLVYGESDLLPGLVIDRFNDIFTIQINTSGMELLQQLVIEALLKLFNPRGILLKNDSSARTHEGLNNYVAIVHGEIPENILLEENDILFSISGANSQKTGWYYDQRDNRAKLANLVKGKRVLDAYSYVGSFGIYAAHYGAQEVVCIDSSASAIAKVHENAQLNKFDSKIKTIISDVPEALKKLKDEQPFDVVLLDPPAFIKKRKDVKLGLTAYQKVNELGIQLLSQDGILITSSCSMHMQREWLVDVVRRASVKNNCFTQILVQGFQAADHPIHPAIPETSYLKTLFCRVVK